MRKRSRWFPVLFACAVAVAAADGCAADAGLFTIVDGPARLLRGATWHRLFAGAGFQEGDVVEAGPAANVQAELAGGQLVDIVGPAQVFAAALPVKSGRAAGYDFGLEQGWLKLNVPAAGATVRVRANGVVLRMAGTSVVVHAQPQRLEFFVETGTVAVVALAGTGAVEQQAQNGEYWLRTGERPFAVERRAPQAFVAAMPHHLTDRLVGLAAKYPAKTPPLVPDREITFAEAEPLLAGPYRPSFIRRFSVRLADQAFRRAAAANARAYPEWNLAAGERPGYK